MNIIFILLFIFLLYLFFIFSNGKFNFKLCAVCGSVFLTWIILIILKLYGINVDILFIGILIGQSITGILYLYEDYFKNRNRFFLSFKIFLVLFLSYTAYLLLELI